MFFGLSKIFWALVQPLNAICLLMAAALVTARFHEKAGRVMLKTALGLFLFFGLVPVGPALLIWLERQYATPTQLPQKIDGIIVLGGAFESYLTKENGMLAANDQIERMFCFIDLAKKYPQTKLVYSGGSGDILNQDALESDDAKAFFKLIGFNRDVTYEEKSRNTYENVLYTKEMVNPEQGQNWVVVTSAYHMPRAVGIFKKQDWEIIPYPCDRRTDGGYKNAIRRLPSVTGNFGALNFALKEIMGNLIYYVTGKSAFILPHGRLPLADDPTR